ncbi:MAG: hypothetical protein NC489_42475 [Ruminococcus flavefaciens]|nr:hypothetical protein [Ruminococcus flavefaciens]
MFICEDCGTVLHEDELRTERSYISDYAGGCYENITTCPCGGDIEEAERCEMCGEYYKSEDLHDGVCIECLREEMTVDNAIKCGADGSARDEVSINGFFAWLFTAEKIDEILLREVERLIKKSDSNAVHIINQAEEWCGADLSYFADWLKSRH